MPVSQEADEREPDEQRQPETQSEVQRGGGSGDPPGVTRVGCQGGGASENLKGGENLACKVIASDVGGYAVLIPKYNLPGFLPTDAKLHSGQELLVQFVGVANKRIVLIRPEDRSRPVTNEPNEDFLA